MRATVWGPRLARLQFVLFCSVIVLRLIAASPVAAGDSAKLTVVGQMDLSTGSQLNSDVWGWVNPANGKEFAIVGEWGGRNVYIIDVSDPTSPSITHTLNPCPGFDVKTWGNYLYAVDGDGLNLDGKIYDISNPAAPWQMNVLASGHNIEIVDGYLYKSVNGLTIYDVSDPTAPVLKWFDGDFNNGHDTFIQGNTLYSFAGSGGTFVYDVTDKSAPVLLGSLTNTNDLGIIYHHNGAVTDDGRYLFITDELAQAGSPDITVWDVGNPANMTMVGSYMDANATVHNVFVVGDLLIASYYTAGVKIFDISTPWNPVLLDTYDTAPAFAGDGFNGCWGAYPFAPSGLIYASDMQNGLFILSFPGLSVPVTISSFDARYADGAVGLDWSIAAADGLAGFNIYRSDTGDDAFARIASLPAGSAYHYADADVAVGSTYWYRLGAVDNDGEFMSPIHKVVIPQPSFALRQNYPNPFNPTTTIDYVVPDNGLVSLMVYNARGERVRTLVNAVQTAGERTATWSGTDMDGTRVASGVYFYRLDIGNHSETRRMILLK